MSDFMKKHGKVNSITGIIIALLVLIIGSIQNGFHIGGVFCGLFLLCVYYGIVFWAWKVCGVIEDIKNSERKAISLLIIILVFSNICVLGILLKEKYVYFWDYVGYWAKAVMMSDLIVSNPKQMLISLYNSVNTDNYNNLIPCIMALPLKILGKNFTMYAMLIFNMFLVPAFITVIYTVKRIVEKAGREFHVILTGLFVITMPVLIQPVLYGYLDAFAFLNFSLLFLVLCTGIFEELDVKKDLLIAALILLCLMGRRYFAYAIIGYVLCVVFVCLRKLIISKDIKVLKHYVVHGMVIAGSFFAVILLGFIPFLEQSFSGTVAIDTAAYQKGNQLLNYQLFAIRYGYLFVILAVAGCAYMIYEKKTRVYGVCTLVAVFVPTTLFYGMQSMNIHHYYITAVPVILAIAVALNLLCKKEIGKLSVIVVLIFSIAISLDGVKTNNIVSKAFSQIRLVAKCREDMSELQRMAADVKNQAEDGKTTYVLASTDILNDDIIRRIDMPEAITISRNLLGTYHVDLRHGFPEHFFDADIVIVASPVQAHLGVDNQHIIADLANEFINHGALEKNYEKIETYQLDNDVEVYMYRRICEIPDSDKEYLRDIFDRYYPDYPELFHDRIK